MSAVLFAVVACENPASGNGDGDPQDTEESSDLTLTLSGEIDEWPGGTGVVSVFGLGDYIDSGSVDESGSFSIELSDLEAEGVDFNAIEVFEGFYNNVGIEANPIFGANEFIALFHDDLVGDPQFTDGDIEFSITGAEKDEDILRGFDNLVVEIAAEDSDLLRRGENDNDVSTRWLFSTADVEITGEAVLELDEDGGERGVDIIFSYDLELSRGWNEYYFFVPAGLEGFTIDDLLDQDDIYFGFSTSIGEPDNSVWEIDEDDD